MAVVVLGMVVVAVTMVVDGCGGGDDGGVVVYVKGLETRQRGGAGSFRAQPLGRASKVEQKWVTAITKKQARWRGSPQLSSSVCLFVSVCRMMTRPSYRLSLERSNWGS